MERTFAFIKNFRRSCQEDRILLGRQSGFFSSQHCLELVELTFHGQGKSFAPGDEGHIDVEVVDMYGNIASVVVRSSVYREYLHLVRTDDGWKIANALWHFT